MSRISLTYTILLVTSFLVSPITICAQIDRSEFEKKYYLSQELIYDQPEKSIELALDAYEIAEKSQDRWAMGMAKYGMGFISYEVGDYKAAYKNYFSAFETLQSSDTSDLYNQVVILNELSLISSEFNNHDASIDFGKKAWKMAKEYVRKFRWHAVENGKLSWLVDIPYYMAIEYEAKGAYQTAGEILFELWENAENKKDIAAYSQVLNELGIIKKRNGEHSDAQEYFGLVVGGNDVYPEDKQIAYHNLGGSYMEQGELERALGYYLNALDIEKSLEDTYSQYVTYLDLGELEYKRGNSDKAINYWETALETYDEIQTNPELYSIYNWLQRAYMDIDVSKAKEYNLKFSKLNDFYVMQQNEQREVEAQNRTQLSLLIDEQRQERLEAEQRQQFIKQFWPVFLAIGLLIIFSGVIGVRYLRTVRANKALAQKQMSVTAVHTRDEAA